MTNRALRRWGPVALTFLVVILAVAWGAECFRATDEQSASGPSLVQRLRGNSENFDARRGTLRKRRIHAYAIALGMYVSSNGVYPYAPSGESDALGLLTPLLPEAAGLAGVAADEVGSNGLFEYINSSGVGPDFLAGSTIILAERTSDQYGGRWCVRNDGSKEYVKSEAGSIVGRED